jgi:hypothetical protein
MLINLFAFGVRAHVQRPWIASSEGFKDHPGPDASRKSSREHSTEYSLLPQTIR